MSHHKKSSVWLSAVFLLIFSCPILLPAQNPHSGDILVSEILFNPEPGGADFVELYNYTDNAVSLDRLRLARVVDDSIARLYKVADSGVIAAHDYLVVTTDMQYVTSHYNVRYPGKMVQVSSMPSYNDASGCVMVCGIDTTILDRFDYTEEMHSRLLRDREGVTLERRSFNTPTQEPSNWYSAATTAGYGTPTYANSQSREFLFLDNDFNIAVTLFSPDGDGYNDLLDISYSLQRCDLSANIAVFDAQGRQVRQLVRGALLGCQGILTWDGTRDDGSSCPRGNYIIVCEAYNESGASQSWRRRISLVRQ